MSSKTLGSFKPVITHKYFPIMILLCINMVIGALVVSDYGESWDEHLRYRYANNSINAYKGIPGVLEDEKGPFFVMTATLGGNLICSLQEDCLISDARHYINFLSFLLGLFFLYRLNLRFTNKWAAFGGALLFNTQPLLWGHAFINPKDLPFMAFFIASIDTGFAMVDSLGDPKHGGKICLSNAPKQSLLSQLTKEWKLITGSKRSFILTTCFIVIIIIAGLFVSQSLVRNSIENIIQDIFTGDAHNFLEILFTRAAQNINDNPVNNYVQKAWQFYLHFVRYLSLSFIIIWVFTTFMILPETRKFLWGDIINPFIKATWINIKDPTVIVAGVFLGLTCSIRTLGPAAGGLIGLYLLARHRQPSLPMFVAYFLISALTTYISWPSLWGAPIKNFLYSLSIAADFPWGGRVLFGGKIYSVGTHPRSYIPVLLFIQFTFTALVTIIFGFFLSFTNMIKNKRNWMRVAILCLWFFVPIGLIIIVEPNLYDNFRHFLFVIPPLFTFAAIGLQSVFEISKRPAIRVIIVFLLILPNIFSLISLHPYQYVYYNIFTNGLQGAFRVYEMDYWGTSYREAAEYINQIAPLNSRIIVFGAPHLVETYARTDLQIEKYKKDMEFDRASPTFAVLLSRYDKDIHVFPEAENIYSVERDGAIFAVVKNLINSNLSAP